MRIGMLSDTHGSLTAWQQVLDNCFAGVDLIVHAGDVLYHGPRNPLPPGYNPQGLARAMNQCGLPIIGARGNCDAEVDQLLLNFPQQAPYTVIQDGSRRILVCHGHEQDEESLLAMGKRLGVSVLVTGHTHIYRLELRQGVVILNPGSPALPKGSGTPTAVLFDSSDGIELLDIRNGKVLAELNFPVNRQIE